MATEMKGRVGRHLRAKTQDKTVQSKLSNEPPRPCIGCCGREASRNRKDDRCENCGSFYDKSQRRAK